MSIAFPRVVSRKEQATPAVLAGRAEAKASEEASTDLLYERYKSLVSRVTDVFGDKVVASRWLSTPSADFASQPPIEFARANGYEVSVLEPVLIRIEHGVDF
jgi:uncharacterized protein (DUF2384 family)